MRKRLFVVSAYQKLWDNSVKDLFIAEPYVYHVLEKNQELKKFNDIEVAPYRHKNRRDITQDSEMIDNKYDKYVAILTERLNQINGTTHSSFFWKKALSLGFIRYITVFYDIFMKCELYFHADTHTCNILSEESYYIPLDFEDQRFCFLNTDYGLEQIFSLYMNLFHPLKFQAVDVEIPVFDKTITGQSGMSIKTQESPNNYLKTLPKITRFLIPLKIIKKIYSLMLGRSKIRDQDTPKMRDQDIRVGIVGSYFSTENLDKLISKSKGTIYPLEWGVRFDYDDKSVFWDKRLYLSKFEADFDRFDQFFFFSLKYCMPKVFIEHYNQVESFYNMQLKKYLNLEHVVSEGWISNTYMSIFLAILQKKNVKHINNEHNAFFHPYVGSFISHVAAMSDIFVSLGWHSPKIPNLVRGSSLFPFVLNEKHEKKYKMLYISGAVPVKMAHYVSAYGRDEENAPRHLEFVKKFFANLEEDTLREMVYRGYPKHADFMRLLTYDKEYILEPYLKKIKGLADTSERGKVQMLQSELVIIDYTATAFIESLYMNIPSIIFWNPDTYYLNNEHFDFFKPLLGAGICHKDPVKAARFVERIKGDPVKWWFSAEVQEGRNEFMRRNLGKPEVMIEYLMGLLKSGSTTN